MRLHLEKNYDIAVGLAQKAQNTKLAKRIHILKLVKFGGLAIDAEEEQELDFDSLLTAPSDQNQPSKKDRKRQKKAGNAYVSSANDNAVSKKRRHEIIEVASSDEDDCVIIKTPVNTGAAVDPQVGTAKPVILDLC